jgi:hypothetical protein
MPEEFTVIDQAWAHDLEKGVENYTDMLFEAFEDSTSEVLSETLSKQPFCGCSACFWREALFYLVPRIIKGYEEGKVELEN